MNKNSLSNFKTEIKRACYPFLSAKLFQRRNRNYPDEYSVILKSGYYPFVFIISDPFHFKTKAEAASFIANKLVENQKVK